VSQGACSVDWILFDFGGVLAEEGFVAGLEEIGRMNGLPSEDVVRKGHDLVYRTGYLLGQAEEKDFWAALRREAEIRGEDDELRAVILDRFRLRQPMLDLVGELRAKGVLTGILSDQVDWLDRLNDRFAFFPLFDRVFNSYHLGLSKRSPAIFSFVCQMLPASPDRVLFIDDSPGHVERARQQGLQAILFAGPEELVESLRGFCAGL
jgi:putative hydrolase of the HAD superfamily